LKVGFSIFGFFGTVTGNGTILGTTAYML